MAASAELECTRRLHQQCQQQLAASEATLTETNQELSTCRTQIEQQAVALVSEQGRSLGLQSQIERLQGELHAERALVSEGAAKSIALQQRLEDTLKEASRLDSELGSERTRNAGLVADLAAAHKESAGLTQSAERLQV